MASLKDFSFKDRRDLDNEIGIQVEAAEYFEDAAQCFTNIFYREFKDSLVLTRVFVTMPYGQLAAEQRAFVDKLARSAGIADAINEHTLTLSLAGTSGIEQAWNDRRLSNGHASIPLATADFIESIPMMSRLLKELGVDLKWITSQDANILSHVLSGLSGVFFVRDAATEVDDKNRRIIAAQDFVHGYGVKSVVGVGGVYVGTSSFFVSISFCRDELKRAPGESFTPLMSRFMMSSAACVQRGSFFH